MLRYLRFLCISIEQTQLFALSDQFISMFMINQKYSFMINFLKNFL